MFSCCFPVPCKQITINFVSVENQGRGECGVSLCVRVTMSYHVIASVKTEWIYKWNWVWIMELKNTLGLMDRIFYLCSATLSNSEKHHNFTQFLLAISEKIITGCSLVPNVKMGYLVVRKRSIHLLLVRCWGLCLMCVTTEGQRCRGSHPPPERPKTKNTIGGIVFSPRALYCSPTVKELLNF